MQEIIKYFFGVLLFLFCLIGCGVKKTSYPLPQNIEKESINTIVKEIKRDTVIKIEADSSYYHSWIECVNGKPKLINPPTGDKKTMAKAGKHLKPPSVSLSDNGKLEIQCEELAQSLLIALKDKHILQEKLKEKTIYTPPIEVEKPLSFWQELWIRTGKISVAIGLIYLTFKLPWKHLGKLF